MRKQARAPGCSARDAQLHPSLTSHPVIPMAVEILKTYLCRGESRNNGSDGDESPGRGRQTCLGRQGAISFLPSACFVRHLLLPHPPNALYNDNPDLAYLRPLLCIIPNPNVSVHSTYISPPMPMHPEPAQGIFVHPVAVKLLMVELIFTSPLTIFPLWAMLMVLELVEQGEGVALVSE